MNSIKSIKSIVTYKSGGIIHHDDCSNVSSKLIYDCNPEYNIGTGPYGKYDPQNDLFNPIDTLIQHLIECKSNILEEVDIGCSNLIGEDHIVEKIIRFKTPSYDYTYSNVSIQSHQISLCELDLYFASHLDVIAYAKDHSKEFSILNIKEDECIRVYRPIWNNYEFANAVMVVTKKENVLKQIN